MSRWIVVSDRVWMLPASRGWVVYVGPTAYYFDEDQFEQAQEKYAEAVRQGEYASPPKPAHMGM
jgi:hypothetical protein